MGLVLRALTLAVTLLSLYIGVLYRAISKDVPIDTDQILKDGGKFIKLKDGRIMEYFNYGSESGDVVVSIHGLLTTGRVHGVMGLDKWGKENNVRGRQWRDFAHDIEQLVDHENVNKFAVVGSSFGGPHAAAVAAHLGERVTRVGLLGSFTVLTPAEILEEIPVKRSLFYFVMQLPVIGDLITHYFARPQILNNTEAFMKRHNPYDWGVLLNATQKSPELVQGLVADFKRSVTHNFRGYSDAFKVFYMPYDFDLKNVSLNGKRPVLIYGSDDDVIVPKSHRSYLHREIPNSKLVSRSGSKGHYDLFVSGKEVLEMLLKME